MALIIERAFGVYPTIVIIRNPHNSIIRKVYKGGKLFIEEFWPGPGIGDSSSVGVLPSTKPPVPHQGTLTIGAGFSWYRVPLYQSWTGKGIFLSRTYPDPPH